MVLGVLLAVAVIVLAVSAHATADGCAVVLRTPDGFLSLRKLPTADSTAVARLLPGEMLDLRIVKYARHLPSDERSGYATAHHHQGGEPHHLQNALQHV